MKVAFIDDGINGSYLENQSELEFYELNGNDIVLGKSENVMSHGTVCAKVFLLNVQRNISKIISIKILEENKKCSIDSLILALEWIENNKITFVNMSLGTSYFDDELKMKKIINRLYSKGIIIISAQNNSDVVTYPAFFSNVISVEAIESNKERNQNDCVMRGTDFCVPSQFTMKMNGIEYTSPIANSFAVPYVTALAVNCYELGMDTDDIKEMIGKQIYKYTFFKRFDWCQNAIVINNINSKYDEQCFPFNVKGTFYNYDVGNRNHVKDSKIDTIIVIGEMSQDYLNVKNGRIKHVVISNDIEKLNYSNSGISQYPMYNNSLYKTLRKTLNHSYIEVPIILARYTSNETALMDGVKLRKKFCDDGYNCRILTDCGLGILYGLDYWLEEYILKDYIEFFLIDILLVIIRDKNGEDDINGDINISLDECTGSNLIIEETYRRIVDELKEE